MTFAELLAARLADMNASQADLARYLTLRGIPTTRQAVSDWCDGTSRPLAWKWKTLFHVVGVTAAQRTAWIDALTAKTDRATVESDPAPAVDADGVVVVPPDLAEAVGLVTDGETLSSIG